MSCWRCWSSVSLSSGCVAASGPTLILCAVSGVLNLFYRHLLNEGRRKADTNTKMYDYWYARRDARNGLGPSPSEIAEKCGTTYNAARGALVRYRRGRVPVARSTGLAPKTVKNVHRMLHRAFKDAVAWDYLTFNPTEHASLPRIARNASRPKPWTLDELAAWLPAEPAIDPCWSQIWSHSA